jgi:hypothetical protein
MGIKFEDSASNKIWNNWDVIEDDEDCLEDQCDKEIYLSSSCDISVEEHTRQIATLVNKKIIDVHCVNGNASILKTIDGKTCLRYEWDNGKMEIFLEG